MCSPIKFTYLNCRGLLLANNRNKPRQIQLEAQSNDSTIIFLTETWLSLKVLDQEIKVHFQNFTLHRNDRVDRRHGGTAILVKNNLPSKQIKQFSNSYTEAQIIAIKNINTTCFSVYKSPNAQPQHINELLNFLESNLQVNQNILGCGDLNFPRITWANTKLAIHQLHKKRT